MKIEIERWVQEVDLFSEEGLRLFEEGILCYKLGAYRAAYLFSYLGFKKSIKDSFLRSGFVSKNRNNERWKNKIKGVEKEEEWEKHFDGIVMTTKEDDNIYMLSEDLKKEYIYWRKKRNDCAHAKQAIFSGAIVESFWQFLQVNMVRFQVSGEKQYLEDKLFNLFKYGYEDNELSKACNQLKSCSNSEISDILRALNEKIIEEFNCGNDLKKIYGQDDYWDKLINKDIKIKQAFLDYICRDFHIFDRFNRYLSYLLNLALQYNKDFLKLLLDKIYSNKFENSRLWFYATELLRQGHINSEQAKAFIDKICLEVPKSQPNELELNILRGYGYLEKWKEILFTKKKVNPDSNGVSYIREYYSRENIYFILNNIEWDMQIVQVLNSIYTRRGYIYDSDEYYRYEDFKSEIINNPKYMEKIKVFIEKYEIKESEIEYLELMRKKIQKSENVEAVRCDSV